MKPSLSILMPVYKTAQYLREAMNSILSQSFDDLEDYPLAKYACEVKKCALASDVCRYNVLSKYGITIIP